MFEKIHSLIESHEKIIIHRHKNPDGDAFGSQIGLYHILKDSYPEKEIYIVGDLTPRYSFMLTRPMDEISDELYDGALAIVLDTSAKALISDERYTLASATARISSADSTAARGKVKKRISEIPLCVSVYKTCSVAV